jgi:hypothetical protein
MTAVGKWIPLTPRADKPRRKRRPDQLPPPPEERKRAPMSPAAASPCASLPAAYPDTTLDGLLVPADPDEAVQALIPKFGIHSIICTLEHELQARKFHRRRRDDSDEPQMQPIDEIFGLVPYLDKDDRDDLIDALQWLNGARP